MIFVLSFPDFHILKHCPDPSMIDYYVIDPFIQ